MGHVRVVGQNEGFSNAGADQVKETRGQGISLPIAKGAFKVSQGSAQDRYPTNLVRTIGLMVPNRGQDPHELPDRAPPFPGFHWPWVPCHESSSEGFSKKRKELMRVLRVSKLVKLIEHSEHHVDVVLDRAAFSSQRGSLDLIAFVFGRLVL